LKIDPTKYYSMPLIMGPVANRERLVYVYGDVRTFAMQYETDSDAIEVLLPNCYRPAQKPTVTVMFGYNNSVDFMAGGGYRIATVQVAARFDGEQDHVEGDYILVMFENETTPIIGGREQLGIPKIYADISAARTLSTGYLRCEASLMGHFLLGMDLAPLKKQNALVRRVATGRINERPWLAYKYIDSLDGPPDADYPTISWNNTKIDKLWLGSSGRIFFGDPSEEDVGIIKRVVDALKTLPIRRVTQTFRMSGSSVLRYDLSRRLR